MKYALINKERKEAEPGLKGRCPGCLQSVSAKCGEQRVWHWAHLNRKNCDKWGEPETEWHRNWKNYYPSEWQEVFLSDEQTGEKHIADVRTVHNLVIEFQHSHIDPIEREAREKFYKNMIWVVDGTRLQRDYPRFIKGFKSFQRVQQGIYFVNYPDEAFPKDWIDSSVPVFFDFKELNTENDSNDRRNKLYCLFPMKYERYSILVVFLKESFIEATINGEWSSLYQEFMEHLIPEKKPQQRPIVLNKRRERPYYYDPQKGRILKKWRF